MGARSLKQVRLGRGIWEFLGSPGGALRACCPDVLRVIWTKLKAEIQNRCPRGVGSGSSWGRLEARSGLEIRTFSGSFGLDLMDELNSKRIALGAWRTQGVGPSNLGSAAGALRAEGPDVLGVAGGQNGCIDHWGIGNPVRLSVRGYVQEAAAGENPVGPLRTLRNSRSHFLPTSLLWVS